MVTVVPHDAVLGATITGVDLSERLSDRDFAQVLHALGQYTVLRFPAQKLSDENLRDFSARFGAIQGSISRDYDPRGRVPEVSVLSNIRRDGKTLGGTEFSSMHAVWRALPEDVKRRLDGATATHDYNKLWEYMRLHKGSSRGPLTAEQRAQRPPVSHEIAMTHPITGTKVLYCNPGYAEKIDGWPDAESEEMLEYLFAFQLRPEFRYTHVWTEGDLLVWDNLGSIHQAIADYRPDEPRLIRRCQVLASEVFTPAFQDKLRAAH